MFIVVDANILFAALIAKEGATHELIFSLDADLISPSFAFQELEKYSSLIVEKSKCSKEEIELIISLFKSKIKVFPSAVYSKFVPQAEKISPDPNDVEYLALALAFNCPLWSNDKILKSQDKVRVLSTSEFIQLLS